MRISTVVIVGALFFFLFPAFRAFGADLEPLKQDFEARKKDFDKVSVAVMDELDSLWEKEKDNRFKAEITLVQYALKENNRWAGRIDAFGHGGLDFDPYKAEKPTEPRKTFSRLEKAAVILKVPVQLFRIIGGLSGTSGQEDSLDKCHFCPEAAQAKEVLKSEKDEFPMAANANPDTPLPLDEPQRKKIIDLVAKNQTAYRAWYETGERLKEKIMRLRPAEGFAYSESSLKEFKTKLEGLYKEKPEYKTQKPSLLEEAQAIAKITGLPEDALSGYQGYYGTMGLKEITLSVQDVQYRALLEIYFTMLGI